jgi:hypothetical protein
MGDAKAIRFSSRSTHRFAPNREDHSDRAQYVVDGEGLPLRRIRPAPP